MKSFRPRLQHAAFLQSVVLLCASTAFADDPPKGPMPAPGAASPAPKSKFDTLTEGKTKISGLWTLYHKEQQLYAELKPSDLGKEYIILPSISRGVSSGMVLGGMSWQNQDDDIVWSFKKVDEKLFVMHKNTHYRAAPGSPEAKAVEFAYSDSVSYALPILTTSPSGGLLVDLSQLFMNDDLQIGRSLGPGFRLATDKSTWGKVKSFPNNVELELAAVYSGIGFGGPSTVPDSKGVQVGIHFSISPLPSAGAGYKPRLADDRIGYFLTAVKDFSNRTDDEHYVRYINRWDLRKKDTSLDVSTPEKPIEFYIEKTTPVFLRPTVEAGILEWNKAFAKLGFSNAIRVQHEEEFENSAGVEIDPEDVRYNFFRWITADAGFAMGPSRVDPRTGQILDADIIFDAGFLDSWKSQYETFNAQTAESLLPNWSPTDPLMPHGHRGGHDCSFCRDMQQQMGYAAATLLGRGISIDGKLPEEFVHQGLKEVVMHEVGHTLGLRHNFKASAWKTLEDINSEKGKTEPTVGSVMDYAPPNIAPKGTTQGAYYTTTLGPYDMWAIEYGYKVFKGDEKAELAKIAARSGEQGLEYLTDEDTRGSFDPDPLSNRFDLGKDSLAYLRRQIANATELMPQVVDRSVKEGEGYQRATQMFGVLFREYWRSCGFASRFPGGVYVSRDHKGDAGKHAPFEAVPAKDQRDAMALISEFAFAAPKIDGPKLNYLSVSRWYHWGMNEALRVDKPIHEEVLSAQTAILRTLLSSTRLVRILDNEYKAPSDAEPYTLSEHLKLIVDSIFSELKPAELKGEFTAKKPMIAGFRRNLQREAIRQLGTLVTQSSGPEDARTLARMHLTALSEQIKTVLDAKELKLDDYTRAHLLDCQAKISQVLDAKVTLPGV